MMAHLTPEQFVDLAEGAAPESSAPHLASCDACRRELADLRAMLSETAVVDAGTVPEPSPLFWNQLSSRVREHVASSTPTGWREWLFMPRVLVPSLAGALAILLAVVLMPRQATAPGPLPIPSTMVVATGALPSSSPSLSLDLSNDPQLRIVADVATTVSWDDMMDEIAMAGAGASDALAGALTVDEQRELQRLLTEELAQAKTQEKRS